jgi:GNAT superfamily N-acetyltransferase
VESMPIIRLLQSSDLPSVVAIKEGCWKRDYAGVVPANAFSASAELELLRAWLAGPPEDLRIMYGAADNEVLVGFAGGSRADLQDSRNGMEVNYLFVRQDYRHRGIAIRLLQALLDRFAPEGIEEVIIYNWHEVPSNQFYRHLHGEAKSQVVQEPGGIPVAVDVFRWMLPDLRTQIDGLLSGTRRCP